MRIHPIPVRSLRLLPSGHDATFQYRRERDLPRLLPLWPDEMMDFSLAGRERLIWLLYSQLRRERRRALARDWTYSLSRHRQLLIAYKAEMAALRMERARDAAR